MVKAPAITPAPGYILTEAYVPKGPFKSAKESIGEDQLSKVLSVGANVTDSEGIVRKSPAKKGDIIIHAATNKTITIDFTEYRFCHFTEVHAIYAA